MPRLVAARRLRRAGSPATSAARLEPRQERRADERRGKRGTRLRPVPLRQLPRLRALERRLDGDRAADDAVAPLVRVERPARPVRRGHDARRELATASASLGDERLVEAVERAGSAPRTASARRSSRGDAHRRLERRVADLGEPVAALLDEVEREPVAARAASAPRTRDVQRRAARPARRALEVACAARPRRSGCRARRASGSESRDVLAAARPPRRRAGVLDLDAAAADARPPASGPSSHASQRTASGPAGTGALRRAPSGGLV